MSELLWTLLYLFIGLASGVVVAGGLFAFITTIGVITRLAAGTKSARYLILYETMVILGASLFNVLDLFRLGASFPGNYSLAAYLLRGGYGLFSGVFTGCLAAALAEVVQVLPVFTRRIRLKSGMPYVMAAFALGKGVGAFLQLVYGAGK